MERLAEGQLQIRRAADGAGDAAFLLEEPGT